MHLAPTLLALAALAAAAAAAPAPPAPLAARLAGLTVQRPSPDLDHNSDLDLGIESITNAADTWSIDFGEQRLVQLSDDTEPVWVTELEKIKMKADGFQFMDITETRLLGELAQQPVDKYEYPSPGGHAKTLRKLYQHLDIDNMKAFLKTFTGFRTRYYRSDTGRQSQQFLVGHIKQITEGHPGITVHEFPHSWGQDSVIVKIASDHDGPVTVIGAHQDSTNQWPFLPAPGADDDGSGTTSSLEALGALAAANYTPAAPVEFHYYSAEEGGLLGSQAIARSYESQKVKVKAMLQIDMTAWVKAGTRESVGIIQDFVDPNLTVFVEQLVDKYLDIPPVHSKCGYACSDHASFTKAGYPSTFAIESAFEDTNHYIHSSDDTIDHPEFSFTHMREFSKLALAFAVELAGESR